MEVDNRETLNKMLVEKQFTRNIIFGTFGEPGYEEAWGQDGIKVDLFSIVCVQARDGNFHQVFSFYKMNPFMNKMK